MTGTRPNIWQLHSRRDIQGLIEALSYPEAEVRKRAAVALRTLEAAQAVPALKAALASESDAGVRGSLTAALQLLEQQTNIDELVKTRNTAGLIEALKSRHADTAIAAARALGEQGDRAAVEPLVVLFQTTSAPASARLAAAEALLQLKSAPAVVTLLGALRRDSWEVRSNAAAVLGQIQATWAVEPLAAALGDAHPVVRRTAAAALRRIGTADAIAALRAHFAPKTEAVSAESPTGTPAAVSSTLPAESPASPARETPASTSASAAPAESPSAEADSPPPAKTAAAAPAPALSEPPVQSADTRPVHLSPAHAADTQPIRLTALPTPPPKPAASGPVAETPSPALVRSLKRILAAFRREGDVPPK